jgi:apolipoprotein N-acyltransferase
MIWDDKASAARFAEVLALSTRAFATKPDLVIWPEAAVPSLPRWDTNLWDLLSNHVVASGAWLIMGADDAQARGKVETDYFNSSFLISPRGEMTARYHKRRLVIFGEYIPLVDWLPFVKWLTPITGGFAAGHAPVPFEMPDRGVRTATLICFEDIFPHGVPEYATPDTDFLVNITNDGWFGEGAAHWQQAAGAVFRAVENGLPLVRCANNGLSCWIDETGGMHEVYFPDSPNIYRAGIKTAEVPILPAGQRRPPTFYNRHGDGFGWGCVAVAGGFALWQLARWRRTRNSKKS